MNGIVDAVPWFMAMAILICCSAFFSASEAALFSLRPKDRWALKTGNRSQQTAIALLADPERLLTAILFWNLVINITYFSLACIAGLRVERNPRSGETGALALTFGALLLLIIMSEMVPKSLGVVSARWLTGLVGLPVAGAVRIVDPLMPVLQLVNLLSRRLIWPRFQPEQYLEVSDLERAIRLSTTDAQLVEQEQAVLQNIVALSELRVDESMRPRLQLRSYRPPVALSDLEGKLTPSGYLLITEPDSDSIAGAIHLASLSEVPQEHLEHLSEPVIYVPWFNTVADTLQQMKTRDREVAAIVNEFGETIGVITFEDILERIFTFDPTHSTRLINRQAIRETGPNEWHVTGMTSLRRLARFFQVELPNSKSVTVAGMTQEALERLPVKGDQFQWGPFRFDVIEVPERGLMTVRLRRNSGG